jgi:hypothetical protein
MKFLYAILVWLGMGALIAAGILKAVHGSPWLFILCVLGFVVAVGRIACVPKSH